MTFGKLILLPNVLDETLDWEPFLPSSIQSIAAQLNGVIAESEKAARRYLRRFLTHEQMALMPLQLLNEHTRSSDLHLLLQPMLKGEIWGLLSDAGLPCIADPGANLVFAARKEQIEIQTIVGPCSLILALQLSGFSGQRFCFHGYLPREAAELDLKLQELQQKARGETQIWIEAPYRSCKMLEYLKRVLHSETDLCVAVNLTMPNQRVASHPIYIWKTLDFPLAKEPAIFLLYQNSGEK